MPDLSRAAPNVADRELRSVPFISALYLSEGEGTPADFEENDLSGLGACSGDLFMDGFECGNCDFWLEEVPGL